MSTEKSTNDGKKDTNWLQTVFAHATLKDGTEVQVTGSDFLEAIQKGLDKEHPDTEAAEKLKFLLQSMLEYAKTQPEMKEDETAAKTLEAMEILYDYLKNGAPVDDVTAEISDFIAAPSSFMAIPRPKGIENLIRINAGTINGKIVYSCGKGVRVTFTGRMRYTEQVIHDLMCLYFADNNYYKAKHGLNTKVVVSIPEVMRIIGKADTERNRRAFRSQLRKTILPTIANTSIEFEDKEGNYVPMKIGQDNGEVIAKTDTINFSFTEKYAHYLNTGGVSQYSNIILKIGGQANPLPYYMAKKLCNHYFMDANRERGVHNIISIKALHAAVEDTVHSFEEYEETDRGHWSENIRDRMEKALNEIQKAGLFKWEYCKKGMGEVTIAETRTKDYRQWSKLYITIKLIPEEPDQTERLEHKAARIEMAKAKKDLKDAHALIRADKIKKKREPKKK